MTADAALATEAAIFRGVAAVEAGLADAVGDPRAAFRAFADSLGRPALPVGRMPPHLTLSPPHPTQEMIMSDQTDADPGRRTSKTHKPQHPVQRPRRTRRNRRHRNRRQHLPRPAPHRLRPRVMPPPMPSAPKPPKWPRSARRRQSWALPWTPPMRSGAASSLMPCATRILDSLAAGATPAVFWPARPRRPRGRARSSLPSTQIADSAQR